MKQLKLDQAIRKLTFGGLEIPLVVIGLGVTGLKKTGVVYLLGFWGERGGGGWEEWWCDFVCVERLGLMIGLMLVLLFSFPRVVFTYYLKGMVWNLMTKLCCLASGK